MPRPQLHPIPISVEITRPSLPPLRRGQSAIVPLRPESMSGIVIMNTDDPTIRKGTPFTFHDGAGTTVTGTVTRRRRQRDGTLKLWCAGIRTEYRS